MEQKAEASAPCGVGRDCKAVPQRVCARSLSGSNPWLSTREPVLRGEIRHRLCCWLYRRLPEENREIPLFTCTFAPTVLFFFCA